VGALKDLIFVPEYEYETLTKESRYIARVSVEMMRIVEAMIAAKR
jgi:hypothetical protein